MIKLFSHLVGKNDILIPPENGQILVDFIPGADLRYFEEPAHWIFVPDNKIINKTILDFLTN